MTHDRHLRDSPTVASWQTAALNAIAETHYDSERLALAHAIAYELLKRVRGGAPGPFAIWKRSHLVKSSVDQFVFELLSHVDDYALRMHLAGRHIENLKEDFRSALSHAQMRALETQIEWTESFYDDIDIPPDNTFISLKRDGSVPLDEDRVYGTKTAYCEAFLANIMWRSATPPAVGA